MKIPVLLSFLLVALLPAYGQVDPRDARVAAVERLLGQLHGADQFEGVALVADEQGLLFQRAYGIADRNWETAATLDTRYLVASITKQFTAGVILKLVEEEKLALDAPLARYLPSWKDHPIGKATLHQLLNHSSGLPLGYQDVEGFDRIELYRRHSTARVLELHEAIEPIFAPGEGHEYSNFAFTLLAAVIERVEEAPYPEVLRKRIFEPLGMRSTLEPELASIVPKMARGYAPVLDDFVEAAPTDLTIVRGAACHASTVGDLFRWERALYRDDFLEPESREAIFTPSSENYGYGWFTQPLELADGRSIEVVRHDGIWPGHMTVVARVPERRMAVILMANRTDVDVNGIADLLLRLLHGETVKLRRHRRRVRSTARWSATASRWRRSATARSPRIPDAACRASAVSTARATCCCGSSVPPRRSPSSS